MATLQEYTVGVGGQARSGKDTLGHCLVRRLNEAGDLGRWERCGFATPVKQIFMDTFDVNEEFVLQKPLPEGAMVERLQRLLAPRGNRPATEPRALNRA